MRNALVVYKLNVSISNLVKNMLKYVNCNASLQSFCLKLVEIKESWWVLYCVMVWSFFLQSWWYKLIPLKCICAILLRNLEVYIHRVLYSFHFLEKVGIFSSPLMQMCFSLMYLYLQVNGKFTRDQSLIYNVSTCLLKQKFTMIIYVLISYLCSMFALCKAFFKGSYVFFPNYFSLIFWVTIQYWACFRGCVFFVSWINF